MNFSFERSFFTAQIVQRQSWLKLVVCRYEKHWMPFLAEVSSSIETDLNFCPPIDIHWVWHVHMLAPVRWPQNVKHKMKNAKWKKHKMKNTKWNKKHGSPTVKSMPSYFMDCVNVTGRLLGHQLTSSVVILITIPMLCKLLIGILSATNVSLLLFYQTSGARGTAGEHKKGNLKDLLMKKIFHDFLTTLAWEN